MRSMLFATFIVLLHAFPLVHGCETTPSCPFGGPRSVGVNFSSGQCDCWADKCESQNGKTINSGSAPAANSQEKCLKYCCANCSDDVETDDDFRRSLLQEEMVCYCNAVNNIPFGICPEPATNFDECSAQCNLTCFSAYGEEDGCEYSPLFVDESKTIDEKSANEYISAWQQSGTSGKVCACKTRGFMIGTNNITNFQEQACNEFCLQVDSLGGVKYWLTTDEVITPPPTSSPTSPPIQKLNTWAVAFLSSVVCVGFLMIAGLFCMNNVGSGST
mmetsp:Transcript_31778/g.47469  ORF Transcript_31778/g.47469 Transcript_31778/m.47469 type:complete len:274 (+) Transcript_31778:164-985(+)